jgi:hypothetical protein
MTMRRLVVVGLGILGVVACRSVPFRETALVPLGEVEPEAMRAEFAMALPDSFRVVNTVTFRFRGKAFAAIGYTDIDTSQGAFTVVGLHPAGAVKLFEVSGNSEDSDSAFALEEFAVQGDLARAVGDDTRRIYFDRLPSPDAKISRERYRILFRQDDGEDGEIEYVFAGSGGVLIEKGYYRDGSKIWTVSYYEYRREEGKLYPEGIVLDHHEYGYRLVVRLREIRS